MHTALLKYHLPEDRRKTCGMAFLSLGKDEDTHTLTLRHFSNFPKNI